MNRAPASCNLRTSSTQMTPVVCTRSHAIERGAADQTEVAVGVADLQTEEGLHEAVVGASDDRAQRTVGTAQLVALHDVDVVRRAAARAARARRDRTGRHRRCRRPTASSRRRSRRATRRRTPGSARGSRRAASAPRRRGLSARPRSRRSIRRSTTTTSASVTPTLSQRRHHDTDHLRDRGFVVVAREEDRDGLDCRIHRIARHTASISSSVSSGKQGNDTHSAAHCSASGQAAPTNPW